MDAEKATPPMSDLPMRTFLQTVRDRGVDAREQLISEGHHPKVIAAKAKKAADKGYTDYGVVVDRPWLTAKGEKFLETTE